MMSNIKDIYGLTPSQEGMYYQYRIDSKSKIYHLCFLFKIGKAVNLELLSQSIELLSYRHEVLNSAFAVSKSTGTVKQVVLNNRKPSFKVQNIEKDYSLTTLDEVLNEIKEEPVDLQKNSLFRVNIIDFIDTRFMIVHTHHIILDGWSMPILFRDLELIYRELNNGMDFSTLTQKILEKTRQEIHFSKYVAYLEKKDKEKSLEYWKNLLEEYEPSYLFSGNAKKLDSFCESKTIEIYLEDFASLVNQFAKEHKISLNTLFESAFGVLLQRYSGSDDVVFCKPISGRNAPLRGIENAVGPFINTVMSRIKAEPGQAIEKLFDEVQNQTVKTNEYGILSLSDLFSKCKIKREFVDVLFAFENYDIGGYEGDFKSELELQILSMYEQTEFPISVSVSQIGDGFQLKAIYKTNCFSEKQVLDLFESYKYILVQMMKSEVVYLHEIKTLNDNQLSIVNAFNHNEVLYDRDSHIYDIFSKQAKMSPSKVAVTFKENKLSYSELLDAVDRYAEKLSYLGVKCKDVVAVHLDRSEFLIVLQLAIIKLGAIFLPVDKRYPQDRLEFLCEDCNVKLFIDDLDIKIKDTKVISLSNLKELVSNVICDTAVYSDNVYIIYTSGSTGTPKGCILRHSGLVNFCLNNNTLKTLNKREHNTFVSVNSVSFDYFIAESLLPLLNGYSIVICDEEESLRQEKFLKVVEKHNVNVLMTTPTRLSLYYSNEKSCDVLNNLTCVCSSGEPLTQNLFERILEVSPNSKVYNPLGPSECTVWDLGGELEHTNDTSIHIGKPIANTQAYILDKSLNIVPIGVIGELCLAGDGVGAGYLGRPELTSEKFIDNPFGEGKLYKTGDLVYLREDGNIVYVGRNDFQVKIRGLRIELGEIEESLLKLEDISATAVIAKHEPDLIVAFYSGKEESESTLRSMMKNKLPLYMVPSRFIHLDSFPLTTSGKIDRAKLLQLELSPPEPELSLDSLPNTPMEKYICDLFSSVLNVENVNRDSNFFDLGGTSLSMISLLSKDTFESITAAKFMTFPTPAQLAKLIEENSNHLKSTYVEPLYIPLNIERAFILFSFAGGDASAYTALVGEMRKRNSNIALYYVDWPESPEIYQKIAEEIKELATKVEVNFYSHCAGSVVALKLLDIINEKGNIINLFIAGASIPPANYVTAINKWAYMKNSNIVKYLEKGGFKKDAISDLTLQKIIKRFRVHTEEFSSYFKGKKEITNCRTMAIISSLDPFTSNYLQAERLWSKAVSNFERTILINCPSHYFQSEAAEQVADILLKLF